MKLLTCPVNGIRPINEFVFGGEWRDMPDASTCTDAEWAAYVHYRNGAPAVRKEWWYHSPSGTWFIAERDTMSDEVKQTYLVTQQLKQAGNMTNGASAATIQSSHLEEGQS